MDPHHFGNLDQHPDPHPHQSDKLDPELDPNPHKLADDKLKCMEFEPTLASFQGFEPLFES
jgi:hypothetical protein